MNRRPLAILSSMTVLFVLFVMSVSMMGGPALTGFAVLGACGDVISLPGTYVLSGTKDCSSSAGNAFTINASDIEVDCRGNTIIGHGSGPGNLSAFLVAPSAAVALKNITITDCVIRDFEVGINLSPINSLAPYADDLLITGNTITDVRTGIFFDEITGSEDVNLTITENILSGYRDDLRLVRTGGEMGFDIYNNAFIYNGTNTTYFTPGSGGVTSCNGTSGNFYNIDVLASQLLSGDCMMSTTPIVGPLCSRDQTETVIWTWGGPSGQVTFDIELKNDTVDYSPIETDHPTDSYDLGTASRTGSLYKINITPKVGAVTGFSVETTAFDIDGDCDSDGHIYDGAGGDDCDDFDPFISPGETEIAFDGIDQNCSGSDLDNVDGFIWSSAYFDGGGTDFSDVGVLNNIDSMTTPVTLIRTGIGEVQFEASILSPLDLTGVDTTSVIEIDDNLISVDSTAAPLFVSTAASLTMEGLAYTKIPVIYKDGVVCDASTCTSANYDEGSGTLTFDVEGFSSFTTGNDSTLELFDQGDPGSYQSIPLETYNDIMFYANYSDIATGLPINNKTGGAGARFGNCTIWIYDQLDLVTPTVSATIMDYDDSLGMYTFENTFTTSADYLFNVTCNSTHSTLYEELSGSDTFSVQDDITPPGAPTIYPLAASYTEENITVAGYFPESDVNVTIAVISGAFRYEFNSKTATGEQTSDIVEEAGTSFQLALAGQNQTFITYTSAVAAALQPGTFLEFGHDREFYKRYEVDSVSDVGYLLIELTEDLEQDVTSSETVKIYNEEFRTGWFLNDSVTLFPGDNTINVFGEDEAGNRGPHTETPTVRLVTGDTSPPAKPSIWPDIPAVTNDTIQVVGMINQTDLSDLTIYFVARASDLSVNIEQFNHTNITGGMVQSVYTGDSTTVQAAAGAGASFVHVPQADYDTGFDNSLAGNYTEFADHNLTYWKRYRIVSITDNPGEEPRLNLDPVLNVSVLPGVAIQVFNDSYPQGWFNQTFSSLHNASNTFYISSIDNAGPENTSENFTIYRDITDPWFDFINTITFASTSTPEIEVGVNDDHTVDDTTLELLTCDDSMVGHWRLDENASTVRDYAGGNDGMVNSAVFTGTGKVNGAYVFDGSNNINVTSTIITTTGNWSIESWAKPTTSGYGVIVSNGWSLLRVNATNLRCLVYDGGPGGYADYNGSLLSQWIHATCLRSGDMLRLYVDGVLEDETNISLLSPLVTGTDLLIGRRLDLLQPFNGYIDEVSGYDRALSPAEIQQHYLNGLAGLRVCGDTAPSCSGAQDDRACTFNLGLTDGSYNLTFEVNDTFNHRTTATHENLFVQSSGMEITSVDDFGDITTQKLISVNWTDLLNNAEFNGTYEYMVQYEPGTVIALDWTATSQSNTTLTESDITFVAEKIYYVYVQAYNTLGTIATTANSDGILFRDGTPPECPAVTGSSTCILSDGPWTQSLDSLYATWSFVDDESGIIDYTYSIGTASYPDSGFESTVLRTTTGLAELTVPLLSLTEGQKYYWNVRARNGAPGAGGTSQYFTSNPVTVDSSPFINGWITYLSGFDVVEPATSSEREITYYVGTEPNISSNVSGFQTATILESKAQIVPGFTGVENACGAFGSYDPIKSVSNTSSSTNVTLTNGMCSTFRLRVTDAAGNVAEFGNSTISGVIVNDQTAPTDITVYDQGFSTINQGELLFNWDASTDPETGIDHYVIELYREPSYLFYSTSINDISVRIFNWSLEHGEKYRLDVTPYNGFGTPGNKASSDGIVFIDAYPPAPVQILSVHNDNNTLDEYFHVTELGVLTFNVTVAGEPGSECYIMDTDLDFINSTGDICIDNGAYNATHTNYTCETTVASQNTTGWEKHIVCRDTVWNTQTYQENTDLFVVVDWPESPSVDLHNLTPTDAVIDSTLFCTANVSDPDENGLTNATLTFDWVDETTATPLKSTNGTISGSASDDSIALSGYDISRGHEIACYVTVWDAENNSAQSVLSINISNTQPSDAGFTLLEPTGAYESGTITFNWFPAFDDDDDHLTYELEVDNGTGFVLFNKSDNPSVSFTTETITSTAGGFFEFSDGYLVFEDLRLGGDIGLFIYDLELGIEVSAVTRTGDQEFPDIHEDHMVYKDADTGTVHTYEISTGTDTDTGIGGTGPKIWGDNILLRNSSGLQLVLLSNLSDATDLGPSSAHFDIHGEEVVWYNGTDVVGKDLINGMTWSIPAVVAHSLHISGDQVIWVNSSGGLQLYELDGAVSDIAPAMDAHIYGDQIIYSNGTHTNIYDINTSVTTLIVSSSFGDVRTHNQWYATHTGGVLNLSRRVSGIQGAYFTDASQYSIDTTSAPDQSYRWRVRACDNAQTNKSCIYNSDGPGLFVLDNTPPTVTIDYPTAGLVVAGIIDFLSTVDDEVTITDVSFNLVTDVGAPVTSGVLSGGAYDYANFDTETVSNGEYIFTVSAVNELGNTNSENVTFTINNDLPGGQYPATFPDEKILWSDSFFDDFTVTNALSSSFKIFRSTGQQMMVWGKTTTGAEDHVYNDAIFISSWPDDEYTVVLQGSNAQGTGDQHNRTFFIDRVDPLHSNIDPTDGASMNASDSVILIVDWDDLMLEEVNVSYQLMNTTWVVKTDSNPSTGTFSSDAFDLDVYVGSTLSWKSTARDVRGLVNTTGTLSLDVLSTPPQVTGTIPHVSWDEGENGSSNIAAYFNELDIYDNITGYSCEDPVDVTITVNASGAVLFVPATEDVFGVRTTKCNATDLYGVTSVYSNDITLTINSMNDDPVIENSTSAAIPDVETLEDTLANVNLSLYEQDVDTYDTAANLTWTVSGVWTYLLNVTVDASNPLDKVLIIEPADNISGSDVITLTLTDSQGGQDTQDILVNVTEVPDVPTQVSVTYPNGAETLAGTFYVNWTEAIDSDPGDIVTYSLEYSINGGLAWSLAASGLIGTAYSWNSSENISTDETALVRINASDTQGNMVSDTSDSTFTLNNKAPQYTSQFPLVDNQLIFGTAITINTTTDELANCTISIDGLTHNVTDTTLIHTAYNGSLSYGAHTALFNCVNSAGLASSLTIPFEMSDSNMSIDNISLSKVILYENEPVNISLYIRSTSSVVVLNANVTGEVGLAEQLAVGAFSPSINFTTRETLATITNTSDIGTYNISNIYVSNADTFTDTDNKTGAFMVFPAINITVNLG